MILHTDVVASRDHWPAKCPAVLCGCVGKLMSIMPVPLSRGILSRTGKCVGETRHFAERVTRAVLWGPDSRETTSAGYRSGTVRIRHT